MSYTWCDDSLKWLPLPAEGRLEVVLGSLAEICPDVDIRRHVTADPVTVSWENELCFVGAFKADLPGHHRGQRRPFAHFTQDELPERHRGVFLAGGDISWTAGWAEGAVQTALDAMWGVVHHSGAGTLTTTSRLSNFPTSRRSGRCAIARTKSVVRSSKADRQCWRNEYCCT